MDIILRKHGFFNLHEMTEARLISILDSLLPRKTTQNDAGHTTFINTRKRNGTKS